MRPIEILVENDEVVASQDAAHEGFQLLTYHVLFNDLHGHTQSDRALQDAVRRALAEGVRVTQERRGQGARKLSLRAVRNSACLENALARVKSALHYDGPAVTRAAAESGAVVVTLANDRRASIVVLDALNFLNRLAPLAPDELDGAGKLPMAQRFLAAVQRVDEFCRAAERSGVELHVVFDGPDCSNEAQRKWTERRLAEVTQGQALDFPYADQVVRARFEFNGVSTYSPLGIDGDDAVAALALGLGGVAVSRDGDFLRYPQLDLSSVCCDWAIDKTCQLLLQQRTYDPGDRPREPRQLPELPPDVRNDPNWIGAAGLLLAAERGRLRLGNADALTRERCGNLYAHEVAVRLRAVVYARAGARKPVAETMPAFEGRACLRCTNNLPAEPSAQDAAMLASPEAIVRRLDGTGQRTKAARAIAASLHACSWPCADGREYARRVASTTAALLRLPADPTEWAALARKREEPAPPYWSGTVKCPGPGALRCGRPIFPKQRIRRAEKGIQVSFSGGGTLLCDKCVTLLCQRRDQWHYRRISLLEMGL